MSVEILDDNLSTNVSSESKPQLSKEKGSFLVKTLIKYGFAKDEKAADIFLIVIFCICVIITAVLLLINSKNSKKVNSLPNRALIQASVAPHTTTKIK